jgi:hypothetical protein
MPRIRHKRFWPMAAVPASIAALFIVYRLAWLGPTPPRTGAEAFRHPDATYAARVRPAELFNSQALNEFERKIVGLVRSDGFSTASPSAERGRIWN